MSCPYNPNVQCVDTPSDLKCHQCFKPYVVRTEMDSDIYSDNPYIKKDLCDGCTYKNTVEPIN